MKLNSRKPDLVRNLGEIKDLLYDKSWARTAPNFGVYYVWRGIKEKDGLRYDITVIPPKMLGKEFPKTKGNRNSNNFSELYTVLKGEAVILMQKMEDRIIKDVAAVKLKKGDWVLIPADYYIVLINPAKKVLKTANWVAKKNKNIYEEVERLGGACYYYTKAGWVKNKNYNRVPKLRIERSKKSIPKDFEKLLLG